MADDHDNDSHESMGDYSIPKSMMGPHSPGSGGGPMGPMGVRGVVFVDRSKLKGAGMSPLAGTYVDNPFEGMVFKDTSVTFDDTYKETYEIVKKKHKWLSKPFLEAFAKLSTIPRHLFRNSIANTTYNPTNVSEIEQDYKNKI